MTSCVHCPWCKSPHGLAKGWVQPFVLHFGSEKLRVQHFGLVPCQPQPSLTQLPPFFATGGSESVPSVLIFSCVKHMHMTTKGVQQQAYAAVNVP